MPIHQIRITTFYLTILCLVVPSLLSRTVLSQGALQESDQLRFTLPTTQPTQAPKINSNAGLVYKELNLPDFEISKTDNQQIDSYAVPIALQSYNHPNIKLSDLKLGVLKPLAFPKYDFSYPPTQPRSAILISSWPLDNWNKPYKPAFFRDYNARFDQLRMEMKYQSTKYDLIQDKKPDLPKRDD